MVEATIRGFKITPVVKPDRELSYAYMQMSSPAVHAYNALKESVRVNGANCVGREDEFSGETLMSDAEAQLACSTCESFTQCEIFAKLGRPAWGVFAGVTHGRELQEQIEREDGKDGS